MMSRKWAIALCVGACMVLAVCSREDLSDAVDEVESKVVAPVSRAINEDAEPLSHHDEEAALNRVVLLTDSADRQLRRIKALSLAEKVKLRRDVNKEHIARARQLGIRPANLNAAIAKGSLVELPDSTALWALHDFDFSVPYVTPSTHVLLTEIAQRFQTKLDSAAVPRYRIVITSALRTPDKQAALRRVNSNASRIESAHEFGTTVDIAYRRFAAPYDIATIPSETVQTTVDSVLLKGANLRSAELQAVLGRVLLEMKQEGKLMVMMEKRQTVYHITVARTLKPPGSATARN